MGSTLLSRRERITSCSSLSDQVGIPSGRSFPDLLGMYVRRTGVHRRRTWTSWSSDHLSPFAMWTALPSADYYGDAVALGLASRRRSRVPLVLNVSSVS